ncbi:ClpP/crotonase-like domain-containing protein, partial [Usnea florida]
YGTITTVTNGSIIRATINNPPVNLWDYKLAADFSTFIETLAKTANTSDVKVVILASANPDFFIDHIDIHALSAASPERPPANGTLTGVQLLRTEAYLQTLPIIFIAEINGRTTGAGNEVAVQCDIRYAGPGAKLSQLEIGFGELPGTGGLQFLVSLIGRARALEYILSARSVDAIEAAAIGWVNKAYGSEKELTEGVTALAERIATFPKQGLAAIKSRVNVQKPTEMDIRGDNSLFTQLEK